MSRRTHGTSPGVASWLVTLALAGVAGAWLTWPVWGSLTAPGRDAVAAETPALLFALLGLVLVLAWGVWWDSGRRLASLAPVVVVSALTTAVRVLWSPAVSGVEPVFALPLLAGVAFGGPAGFLTGAVSSLVSAAALGLIAPPLVGQTLVWGLWGLAGGLLHSARSRTAWLLAVPLCIPLGLLSGGLLNLIGWTGETSAEVGAFLPGLPWDKSLARLWEYTRATSAVYDLTRAATNAVVVLVLGLPLVRALRAAWGSEPGPTPAPVREPRVRPTARSRRARSRTLSQLWNTDNGGSE